MGGRVNQMPESDLFKSQNGRFRGCWLKNHVAQHIK